MITGIFGLLSIIMVSWFLGLLITAYLKRQHYYSAISNICFINSNKIYSVIGIQVFKWLVTRTIYRYLNKNIKLSSKPDLAELNHVRDAMIDSEVLHGVAFIFVVLAGVPVLLLQEDYNLAFQLVALNVVLNLYPTLLQQYNKAKLNKVISKTNHELTTPL
jgi:hypothetical protein